MTQFVSRFTVVSDAEGHHVLDGVKHTRVVGPFALKSVAQKAADQRNQQHAREQARRPPK